jgi:nucleoside-diphosphate-sugar epimerase
MQPVNMNSEAELDEWLTRPRPVLVGAIRGLSSPLVILGGGGKMGPSLAVLARRAAVEAGHPLEVIVVSRFRDVGVRGWLEGRGVHTLAADLLDPQAYGGLPDAGNVAYLVGLKFGTSRDPASTWVANTLIPARVSERYAKARITALSTGNVYPFSSVEGSGAVETDPLTPVGEYANAAVARERIFEWFSRERGIRVSLLRLSYAVDLRYGVVVDIAQRVARGEPVDLSNGHFNCIWQGDANEAVLRSFELAATPATAWNLCRPEAFSVRETALAFGRIFGREVRFEGTPGETALLSNTSKLSSVLGDPSVSFETLLRWVAHWVAHGGRSLGKPTHFENRDGHY